MSLRGRLEDLEREGTPIRIGLVGAGQMGRGFIAQVAGIPGMETVAVADVDSERGRAAFREVGLDPVEGINGIPGRPAVTEDATELARSETVDVVVEATGVTEAGVYVVVRSREGAARETMEYLGMGEGPNHVLYRPYHLTSLETPLSVARAVIHGEAGIVSRERPAAEVVAVAKRDLGADEKLGGIGGADYYGTVYAVSEAEGTLPVGLAAGARTTRPWAKGSVISRAGVDLAKNSFVVNLRQLQDAAFVK